MNSPICSRLYLAGILSLISLGHAQENGPLIELPPYVVEESITPPWRFAAIPGVEVISRSPDLLTKQLITGHHRLHSLLALMIPPELQLQRETPLQYTIYIKENQSAVTKEMVASIEQQEKKNQARSNLQPNGVTFGFMPNFRFWDTDSLSIFFVVDLDSKDTDEISLSGSYVRYLIEDRTPMLPRWYIEGMMRLYPSAVFSEPSLETSANLFISNSITQTASKRKEITLKSFTWDSSERPKSFLKRARKKPELLPLPILFTGAAADLADVQRQELWKSQSALFIRWALDPASSKGRDSAGSLSAALRSFVQRSSTEPTTETLFQECFGMSFAAAEEQLRSYLPKAMNHSVSLLPGKTITVPEYTIRDATTLEVSRIKGALARQEITYVRAQYPNLTEAYIAQARRVL